MAPYLAYLRGRTQWRHAPMGGRSGLDYPALDKPIELAREDYEEASEYLDAAPEWDEREVWNGLQVIEHTVLACQAERIEDRDRENKHQAIGGKPESVGGKPHRG